MSYARARRHCRAFTLIEAVVSSLIVAAMLTAALRLVGAAALAQQRGTDASCGALLAADLMSEIQERPYKDPNDLPLLGLELSELLSGRSGFDDVDDYHGLNDNPPSDRAGSKLPGFDGWSRRVRVEYVNPLNTTMTSGTDTGVLRITVTVLRGGRTVAQLVGLRTAAADGFIAR